jgi:hypothetical protein
MADSMASWMAAYLAEQKVELMVVLKAGQKADPMDEKMAYLTADLMAAYLADL